MNRPPDPNAFSVHYTLLILLLINHGEYCDAIQDARGEIGMCALVGYRSGQMFFGGSGVCAGFRATLSGTVIGFSDAAIPNAEITITAEATGVARSGPRVARILHSGPTDPGTYESVFRRRVSARRYGKASR